MKRIKEMAMSRDRVRFTIQPRHFCGTSRDQGLFRDILYDVFGIDRAVTFSRMEEEVTIVCRPSQFARFLIARNIAGLRNGFQELKPEMFILEEESPKPVVYNVSKRHHDAHRCQELYTVEQ